MNDLKKQIEKLWENKEELSTLSNKSSVEKVIKLVDEGKLRAAEPFEGSWKVNEWIKKAILLYFLIKKNKTISIPPFNFYDKIPLKADFEKLGARVVPHALARYGSFISKGAILMPSYVNIGAYVGQGSMIDTWATVGSCAQIGSNVHLSGGVGVGGVLEPLQASPVIVEDGCFIGSRCILVEGVRIKKRAVLGANVVLTKSTKIIDLTGSKPVHYKSLIPEDAVVIPGSYEKSFNAGKFQVPCALIIGKRKESTNLKTSLNQVLRDFEISL